ncbi:hypothetical protein [Arthrobacter sp. UYEF36]|uniref:hypothetical protein n=1 Tax=Arthrobacter sp. UYEF36 TaxID=1756366 RepID=UPI0033973D67
MALFSKNMEQATAAASKAADVVAEWEAKAAAARAEAARLDAESGAAILEDESAAERITLNVQTWERKARAYDQAAEEARRKHVSAYREALEVEAREEDKQAAAAGKTAAALTAKVAALVGQLKELENVDFAAVPVYVGSTGKNYALPNSEILQATTRRHEVRAALIRYYIQTGTLTNDVHDLNQLLGTALKDNAISIGGEGIEIPGSLLAARDAGLSFVGA